MIQDVPGQTLRLREMLPTRRGRHHAADANEGSQLRVCHGRIMRIDDPSPEALMAIERSASDYAAHIGVPEVVAGYDGLEIALSPALPKSG